jgi:hypothetical protein
LITSSRLHPTAPHHPDPDTREEILTTPPNARKIALQEELLHAAFRDVHAARLHGFALLVALGDREAAGRAASSALAAGLSRAHELRHPERAAAWLRAEVVRDLRRRRLALADPATREGVLATLGATPAACRALGSLSLLERAAIVAEAVERLDPIDVETVIGKPHAAAHRILRSAREAYLRACLAASAGASDRLSERSQPEAEGELARRVAAITSRVLAPHASAR